MTVEVRAAPSASRRTVRRPRPASPAYGGRPWVVLSPAWARRLRRFGLPLVVLLVVAGTINYLRPIPDVAATTSSPVQSAIPGAPPSLPWPSVGSAAVGASGPGLIAASGDASPAPAASVAKVMTAMVVLVDKPLLRGASGPTLVITDQDVATYQADLADQQSVVPVMVGEQLTEFQALEALLIPSGNNIAETLARWGAGSVTACVAKMYDRAAELHTTRTVFADPAGVSIQTGITPS